jgi:hypothetical protein
MHCGRFFAVDYNERLKLLWSSGGINDWKNNLDGCGYAYLTGDGGEILKLVNFDEKLIAVRCNGLSVIRAYGDPQNFKIDESSYYYTADGIIENTISVCDNKLIFCTESGIFAFDGNDVERQECDDSWDICAYQSAVSYGDRYLIMCSSKRLGKDVVYVYEPSEKLGYFIDFSPECIYAGDGVYAVKDSGLYCLSEGKACGVWKKSGVNFGLSSKKVLRSIAVECSNDIVVKVKSGTASKTYFGGGVKSVRLSGFEFDFEISGNGEAYSLVANAEVIDEV